MPQGQNRRKNVHEGELGGPESQEGHSRGETKVFFSTRPEISEGEALQTRVGSRLARDPRLFVCRGHAPCIVVSRIVTIIAHHVVH